MIRHLLAILLLASTANAVDFFLDTDCANHGDGTAATCAASAGGAGAFNNLSAAESDLESQTGSVVLYATGTAKDTTSTMFDGGSWTDLTVDGQGEYVVEATGYNSPIDVRGVQNLTLKNMSIGRAGDSNNVTALQVAGLNGAWAASSADGFVGENLDIYDAGTVTTGDGTTNGFVHLRGFQTGDVITLRNVFVRGSPLQDGVSLACNGGETVRLHNITIHGNAGRGLADVNSGGVCNTIDTKNVLSDSNTGDDFSQGVNSTDNRINATNASSDATSPDTTLRNVVVSFVSSTDLHLVSTDTDVIDKGTTIAAFDYDIDGDTRPSGAAWDIGADEYLSAAAVNIIPILTEIWGY